MDPAVRPVHMIAPTHAYSLKNLGRSFFIWMMSVTFAQPHLVACWTQVFRRPWVQQNCGYHDICCQGHRLLPGGDSKKRSRSTRRSWSVQTNVHSTYKLAHHTAPAASRLKHVVYQSQVLCATVSTSQPFFRRMRAHTPRYSRCGSVHSDPESAQRKLKTSTFVVLVANKRCSLPLSDHIVVEVNLARADRTPVL